MYAPEHNLSSLFLQIGLDNSEAGIESFINAHKPLAHDVLLYEADFWNPSQAVFLQQAVAEDADWALIVDQLDLSLR